MKKWDNRLLKIISVIIVINIIILVIISIKVININSKKLVKTTISSDYDTTTIYTATEISTEQISTDTESPYEEFSISMNFVGDLLLATNHNQAYENCFTEVADKEDPSYFLSKVSDIFLNDDITVGDCENVFSDNENLYISDKGQDAAAAEYEALCTEAIAAGEPVPENDFKAFWFKSKAANANILSAGGIDIVSVDNNHIDDYGQQGKDDTKAALEAAGVEWGSRSKTVYREINGFRIAFVFGVLYHSGQEANIIANLDEAKTQSDYQVVYFHGGTEAIHEPEEWKINACHNIADNGADLILGDHPHVLQPMEEYNGVSIVYSLGNFCFGGNMHPENRTIIFNQTLSITKDKNNNTFNINGITIDITPCYVYTGEINNWQPAIIDDEEAAAKVLDFMNQITDSPL